MAVARLQPAGLGWIPVGSGGGGGWFVNEIKTIVTQFKRGSSSRFFLQISQVIGAHVAKQRVAPQQPFRREARLCELGQAAKR